MSVIESAEFRDLDSEAYHADLTHDSNSTLRIFEDSPGRYYHLRITGKIKPRPQTDTMRLGSVAHAAILEPGRFSEAVAIIPAEVLTKDGKRAGNNWKAWKEEQGDKLPITVAELDEVMWKSEAVWKNPACADLLRSCTDFERSIFWTDALGNKLKVRLDAVNELDAIVVDIKNSRYDAERFWQSVQDYAYHAVDALYSDGFEAMYGSKPAFRFLLISSEPPYDNCVRTIPVAAVELGRELNKRTLARIAECRAGTRPWCRPGFDIVKEIPIPGFFYPTETDFAEYSL